jgi:hypothetical protein
MDTLSLELGNMTMKKSKSKATNSKSKKTATISTRELPDENEPRVLRDECETKLLREEEIARQILLSSEYSPAHFASLFETLPPDWVVCSVSFHLILVNINRHDFCKDLRS